MMSTQTLKDIGDTLPTQTQYGVVKCGSACIKTVYEICSQLFHSKINAHSHSNSSPSQERCDEASCNTGTRLARAIISSSIFVRFFGKHEFGLTLRGITRGVTTVLRPLGYTGRKVVGASFEKLKNHLESGLPCIILYLEGVGANQRSKNKIVDGKERNALHYSIVYHISDTHVFLRDPNYEYATSHPIDKFLLRRVLDTTYLNDRRAKLLYRARFVRGNSVIFIERV